MSFDPDSFDAAAVLETLTAIRNALPRCSVRPVESDGRASFGDVLQSEAVIDFESLAVVEALESLLKDVTAIVEEKNAALYRTALEIYYAMEELSRDPANAHLIPHVEELRRAYEQNYGRAVPPKG
jgi:hypothetical protein